METRANYALIGLFTLVVIAAAFGFVYWFSGTGSGQRREPVRIVFDGSVSGLSRGSAVSFNGIRVGEVTEMRLVPDNPKQVAAIVEVDRSTPLRDDTKARLEFQGLTGIAQVALVGGEQNAAPLKPKPGESVPTIYAERSGFQDLLESARTIAQRADSVLEKIDRVVSTNEGTINTTLKNVEHFSQALNDNAPNIDRFLTQVGQAAERIGPLAAKLETLATNVDDLVQSVDKKRVANIVANADAFTQSLADNKDAIDETLRNVASLTKQLNETAPKLDVALANIESITKAVDPEKLSRVVDNTDKFTQALGDSSPDITKTIAEARSITEKLNKSADRVDDVLKAAQTFLGTASGPDGKGMFDEIKEAARSIRVLADNLDKRTAEITTGITKFTGPGLKEFQELASDGRKTLNQIDRAVKGLEKNPQQLLFGGRPSIQDYNGRR